MAVLLEVLEEGARGSRSRSSAHCTTGRRESRSALLVGSVDRRGTSAPVRAEAVADGVGGKPSAQRGRRTAAGMPRDRRCVGRPCSRAAMTRRHRAARSSVSPEHLGQASAAPAPASMPEALELPRDAVPAAPLDGDQRSRAPPAAARAVVERAGPRQARDGVVDRRRRAARAAAAGRAAGPSDSSRPASRRSAST